MHFYINLYIYLDINDIRRDILEEEIFTTKNFENRTTLSELLCVKTHE